MLGDWTANGECAESEFPKPVTAADTDSLIFSGRERMPHRLHCLVNHCSVTAIPVIFRPTKAAPRSIVTERPEPAASDTDIGPLLDAFGQVLSVYGQASFDLPGRPASQVLAELEPWRRHAVLGIPVTGSEHVTQHGAFDQRNFKGAAQVFAELRRVEKQLAESALTDLRECLWTCVNRAHAAVQADHVADSATAAQLKRVEQAIQGIETGAVKDEVMQALNSIEHISRMRRDQQHASFAVLAERIKVLGIELEVAQRDSETDALTGLGNRKRFEVAIERAMHLHALSRTPLSLLMMDLDGLKQINDTLGHSAGDVALTSFAACLAKVFLYDSDELCRIGGDEFVVLLPGTKLELAERLAHRLVDHVAALSSHGVADAVRIGVSIGCSQLRSGEGVSAWMARTDAALYDAKANGRGRAVAA